MRITTRLRIASSVTIVALLILVPLLIRAASEFRDAKSDYVLADAIQENYFERASFRDQYFLHREERVRVQWDANKAFSDSLLRQAEKQFQDEKERQLIERLRRNIDETAAIFHRIVSTAKLFGISGGNRHAYDELDRRLYSQLLLKASAVRDTTNALQNASAQRVEQTYRDLVLLIGVFAITLALSTLQASVQINRLIRRRLAPLHAGAKNVADGHLDYRIECDGSDEFTELGRSINGMTESLQASTQRLEAEISAHLKAEEMLRKLSAAVEQSPTSTLITDLDASIEYVNPRFSEVTGYSAAEAVGQNPRILQSGQTAGEIYRELWNKLSGGQNWNGELLNKRKNGEFYWEETHIAPIRNAAGEITHYVAIKTDISARKQTEEKLQLAASVFTHAREGIMVTSTDGTIIDINDAFTRITGYSRDEAIGENPRLLRSGRQDKEYYIAMWRGLTEDGYWYGEVWNRRKNGEVYAEMLTVSTVRDSQGKPRQYVALFSDITGLKEHEKQLEHIAHYDALTNLPNRVLFADRLHQAMVQAQRNGKRLAVAYLDLDGFKAINDTHGHEAGDQLLIAVASRLTQVLREGDTVARIGGDEFVAILLDVADDETSISTLTRMVTAAAQPVPFGDAILQVSTSIGVTFYPQAEEVDADQLLRQADQTMYQAKQAGKNRFHVFNAAPEANVV
ncbi:MAG: diguanylate cyclase [Rhodocyclaceae bacterium]